VLLDHAGSQRQNPCAVGFDDAALAVVVIGADQDRAVWKRLSPPAQFQEGFVSKTETEMIAELMREAGCDETDARQALAATGASLSDAKQYLSSVARQNTRAEVVRIYADLPAMAEHEVIAAVARLQDIIAGPVKELKTTHADEATEAAAFLAGAALKDLEKTYTRRERAYERRCYVEVCTVIESLLRDVVCVWSGVKTLARNDDVRDDGIYRNAVLF